MEVRSPDADKTASLLRLPAELIDSILSYLTPEELTRAGEICKLLQSHILKDKFWIAFLASENASVQIPESDAQSSRHLFLSHYPHWFLTRYRIWFSDLHLNGKLILARYNTANGHIEAFNIAAERGHQDCGVLNWYGSRIIYDTFDPRVRLDLNVPVIRLAPRQIEVDGYRFEQELLMDIPNFPLSRMRQSFVYAKSLHADTAREPSVKLWPPRILPSPESQRIRTESSDGFRGLGHKPTTPQEVSTGTFRIRQLPGFSSLSIGLIRHVVRNGGTNEVHAFGTLPPEAYTPTPERPWRGIWCGDYNAHGCEFLVILQPDEPKPLPLNAKEALRMWPNYDTDDYRGLIYLRPAGSNNDDENEDEDEISGTKNQHEAQSQNGSSSTTTGGPTASNPYHGRLEAIKLTGDPNIPRGEYSFIVPDLGDQGLIGYAQESIFEDGLTKRDDTNSDVPDSEVDNAGQPNHRMTSLPNRVGNGARMVRSVGHVANRGFAHDAYIPSQIILVSENKIAQYWRPFGHISFYQRVDLDALMNVV